MPRTSLVEYFDQFFARGRGVAYAHRRGYRMVRWDYQRVAAVARQFARELQARGVAKGDRVMLWGENSAEWAAAFFGCVLRGAVVIPMDRVAAPDFARRVAQQVDAKLVVASRRQPTLDSLLPSLVLEDLPPTLAHHSSAAYASPPLTRADIVQIIFTSGTTAEPKGVVITHGNVLANLEPLETEIAKYLKYERIFHPLRFLNLLPLSHVFGQFMGMWIPPLLGGVVIFQETLNPSEVIRAIRRERVSVLVAVPRMLESLKDKLERDLEAAGRMEWFRREFAAADGQKFTRRMWRFRRIHGQFGWKFWAFVCGGAALDAETEAFWSRLGFAVIQGYGMTETTSLVSVNHPFKLARGAIGKVLPGREIKLAENGEILVRGESIAAGYWQGKGLQPVLGDEGWLRTGDMGELDADGNLYFKGRQKNVIITPAGMNVYPEDLEAALRRQPEVRDCVVVGLPVNGNAEPCAVLLLHGGAGAEAAVKHANELLAEFQHVRRWYVWPEEDFPRTPTQKPKLNVIRETVIARLQPAAGASAAPAGTLAELIARVTGRAPASLRPDANLTTDLDLSSIDRVELMSAIEDRLQADVNETSVAEATTVGQLEKLLRDAPARRSEYAYPRWAQYWPVRVVRLLGYYLLTWPATLLMTWPAVRGRENLRGVTGPMLVVSNHVAYLDIGFLLWALPPRFRHRLAIAMGGEMLQAMRNPPREWNPLRRWLEQLDYFLVVALFHVFPLPQRSGFRESFAFAGDCADRGYNVVVFPEGRRTPDGELHEFRAGIGLLANNLALPVLPMRIDGLYPLKVRKQRFSKRGTVRVSIGKPVRFAPGTEPEQIARELRERVAALEWK
jgi:long-chain acyl-CoA synthetase